MTYILYLVKVVVLIISVIAWNAGQRHKKPSPRYWYNERIDSLRFDSTAYVIKFQ
jgi:hypothetical protein